MGRFFEVATKMNDGVAVRRFNEETQQEEIVKWDVDDEHLPAYKTKSSAGADFCAVEEVIIPSIWKGMMDSLSRNGSSVAYWLGELIKNGGKSDISISDEIKNNNAKAFRPTLVHTGIKAKMEDDEVLKIFNRSSGPKKGLVLANSVGIIDADYYSNKSNDGEIMFAFYNFMPFDITIKKGDAIGQGVFEKVLKADKVIGKDGLEVDTNTEEERTGGFGSTSLEK